MQGTTGLRTRVEPSTLAGLGIGHAATSTRLGAVVQRALHTVLGCAAALALVIALLAPTDAHAVDPSDLGVSYKTIVKGKQKPALVLQPTESIRSITIKLKGDKGETRRLKAGRVKAGSKKTLSFKQAIGKTHYQATVSVKWASGESSDFTMSFDAVRVGNLKMSIKPADVDLDERRVACRATNPIKEIELVILGKGGEVLEEVTRTFDPPSDSGEELGINWPELKEDIVQLRVKVTDVAGYYTGMRITPFSIEIPHEEVEFESGKSAVRDSESPKLEETMGHIKKALAEHGTLLTLKLFVGGYTDTVGSKSSNRELSKDRARAIARWFRKRGLKMPIYYQGFGEDVLAVPTPDDTAEVKNRRAIYVLSSHVPSGKDVPTNAWHRL